ncbi:MAG: universal stress protein [Deltaproteobacteria bacterium]|nr:MAG: universal stress protein [Deltaproteobacteria bacterium]
MKLKKIMVAVDGSDHSMRAAAYASDFAVLGSAEILLVYCRKRLSSILGEPYLQQAVAEVMEKSNLILEPFREMFREKGVPFSDRILEGSPGNMIAEAARIENCDMIIMGSRGRSDFEGLLLGSVTHRVLQAAECPVLVVR